jgi:hypothetical protein
MIAMQGSTAAPRFSRHRNMATPDGSGRNWLACFSLDLSRLHG